MVARCDPQKDYQNLLLALQIFCKKTATPWKFLIVGRNTESLAGEVERLGLAPHILILGARHDIAHVLNALDVHVLSSAYGEGFPNVLAEAMACGVPCVATDVGDAARIVENTGWIVAPRDPEFLADALNQALASYQSIFWEERKSCALHRIENHFSIEKMRSTYHDLWLSVHQ
jgi:glycosyltransferase involved in cell wall biosynthesis